MSAYFIWRLSDKNLTRGKAGYEATVSVAVHSETLYTRLCYTCVSVASGGCYNKNTLTPSRYCMRFTISYSTQLQNLATP